LSETEKPAARDHRHGACGRLWACPRELLRIVDEVEDSCRNQRSSGRDGHDDSPRPAPPRQFPHPSPPEHRAEPAPLNRDRPSARQNKVGGDRRKQSTSWPTERRVSRYSAASRGWASATSMAPRVAAARAAHTTHRR
jgi:hypothetical protein